MTAGIAVAERWPASKTTSNEKEMIQPSEFVARLSTRYWPVILRHPETAARNGPSRGMGSELWKSSRQSGRNPNLSLPRASYLESFGPTERLQDADELAKWRIAPGNR